MTAQSRETGWWEAKREAWERLWEDLRIGYLDDDILDVLVEIFLRPRSYSKSSCSGRITVIDAKYPWAKDDTMTVFKKHSPVSYGEIERVLSRPWAHRLWLSVQGPIYHVYVESLSEAEEILAAAREAGFKHSGVMVLGETPLVELRTGVRADVLLADDERLIVEGEALRRVVDVANDVLRQAKERNRRLLEALRKRRPSELWRPAEEKARQLGLLG
ncbi:tRNA(Phe) 7-((3-amino-3-carboxypropyl)-4-demethylwyosine(37)-N(4))-methyltransferase [Pyrodictium abyssi]|uniref:tRNA(Phe) 7-((3-amino-3-carboxypropyl)-4-demethylwyosine(37)-N(4))-methyltransferase n=1 Tax=Pyrodictium abyssi TaxID=54256 RepID=A0ABM8IVB3_9CREN|nr:hypothetical protein PABY_10700 [Pyrodictium abyssi]